MASRLVLVVVVASCLGQEASGAWESRGAVRGGSRSRRQEDMMALESDHSFNSLLSRAGQILGSEEFGDRVQEVESRLSRRTGGLGGLTNITRGLAGEHAVK